MSKIDEAKDILEKVGLPRAQTEPVCVYALLCLGNICETNKWEEAKNDWIRIHDILSFTAQQYGVEYAENTRETIRKQAMHHFRNAALIEDNGKATNSPAYRYRLTDEFLKLIKTYGTNEWDDSLSVFSASHEALIDTYSSKKEMKKMSVRINMQDLTFSPGKHNALQKAIIEEFAPRFAENCVCLYVGDTIKKDLICEQEKLTQLGFEITVHEKMPDVVLYIEEKNWVYFIEAVTSVGPMSPKRILEIESMTKNVNCGKIYVTAFPDFLTYKQFSEELAWETEVWISEMPDHMIHLNGDKFMGPR